MLKQMLLPTIALGLLFPIVSRAEMPWGITFNQHPTIAALPNKQAASWAYSLTWLDRLMQNDAKWLFRFHRSEQDPRVVDLRDTSVQQIQARYTQYDQYITNNPATPSTAMSRMVQRKGAIVNSPILTGMNFARVTVEARCREFVAPALTLPAVATSLLECLNDDVPVYLLVNLSGTKANGAAVKTTVAVCGQRIAGKGIHAGMFDPNRSESFYWNLSANEVAAWLETRKTETLDAQAYTRISWVAMKRQTRVPLDTWKVQFDQGERLRTKPNKTGVCWSYSLAWIDILAANENLSLLRHHPNEVRARFNLIGLGGTTDNLITRYDRFGAYWQTNLTAAVRNADAPWLTFQGACIMNDNPITTYQRVIQPNKCKVFRGRGLAVYGTELFKAFRDNGPAYYMLYIGGTTRTNEPGAHAIAAYAETLQGRGTFAALFDPNQGEVVHDQISEAATQIWLSKVCETIGFTGPNSVSEVSWVVLTKRP